jgi:hypothetical protein
VFVSWAIFEPSNLYASFPYAPHVLKVTDAGGRGKLLVPEINRSCVPHRVLLAHDDGNERNPFWADFH